MSVDPPSLSTRQRSAVWQALGFAWDFGIVVVVPLLVLGIGGRLLDRKLGTSPWFFLGGVIVSVLISTALLIVRLKAILKKITQPPTPPPHGR